MGWLSGNELLAGYLTRVVRQSSRAETEYLIDVESATEALLRLVEEELGVLPATTTRAES